MCPRNTKEEYTPRSYLSWSLQENVKFYGLYSFLVRGNYSNKSCNNFKMKILYNHSIMLYPTPLSAPLNNMDPFKHIDKILVKRNSNKSCNNLMKIKIFYHHSNMFYPFSCSASLNNLDTFKHTDKMLQITVDYTYILRKQLERFSIITLVYLLFFPHLDQSLINWICMLH